MMRTRWSHSIAHLVAVALLVALPACSDDPPKEEKAPAPPPPAAPVTDTGGPAAYAEAREKLLVLGRAATAAFLEDRLDDLVANRAPGAGAPTRIALAELRQRVFTVPLGDQVDEAAVVAAPGDRFYESNRKRGEAAVVSVKSRFDAAGRLVDLTVVDRAARPSDTFAGYDTTTPYRLPFDGVWWVRGSPDLPRQSLHYESNEQRYAFDFQVWRHGSTHRGSGKSNTDHYAWNQAVRVPASGSVVRVVDGRPDHRPGAPDANDPLGNHVMLDEGNGEYLVLAHLRKGSIRVKRGQLLGTGQLIATVGNSGSSVVPMLHAHLQSQPAGPEAKSIPLTFANYTADGAPRPRGRPVQGQLVVIVPERKEPKGEPAPAKA